MALVNPSIALGVQPVQIADPLAQYGKIAAIQGAQQQNALAQYQLGAAQRAEAGTNALSQAYQAAYNPQTGEIDRNKLRQSLAGGGFGAQIPGVEKALGELDTQALTRQKTEGELFDTSMKQIRNMWGNVRTPEEALAVHDATHRDPIINKRLRTLGVTEQMGRQQILEAAKNPQTFNEFIQKAQLGAEKFMELNKPTITSQNLGGQVRLVQTPGLGGATTVVPGSQANVTMSPYEQARIGQENQRLQQEATGVVYQEDSQGNVIALPSRLKKGEVPTARLAVAPGGGFQPLQGKPSEAVGKEQMSLNQQKEIVKGALAAIKSAPSAFGAERGLMGEAIGGKFYDTPAEAEARAYVYNVVSGVIKERAGTAQSASEKDTLNRFLPSEYDNADQLTAKFNAFNKYLADKETGTTKKRGAPEKPPLSPMDQEALKWANSNPADPRAAAIKQRLGM